MDTGLTRVELRTEIRAEHVDMRITETQRGKACSRGKCSEKVLTERKEERTGNHLSFPEGDAPIKDLMKEFLERYEEEKFPS